MNKILLFLILLFCSNHLFSQDADFYFDRATYRANNDDILGSIADWNMFLEIEPDNVTAYHNRGIMKLQNSDYIGAISDLAKVSQLPYIRTYVDIGDIKQKDDKRYWQLQISAYHNKGKAKLRLDDFRGAIEDYSIALEMDPESDDLYRDRGVAKAYLEDYRGALADFNKAIELNPNLPIHYINRGAAKLELGQKDSGCLDFSKAGELGLSTAYDLIREMCD